MSAIQVSNIEKEFKGVQVLKSVSLDVRDCEFCVLLGPSGCGKTTLLRIIAGLEKETAGELRIGTRRVNGLAPGARNIAMVFQNYAVFPHLTIRDNIGFGLKMRKDPPDKITRQVDRAAAMMHIENLLDRYSGQLSGGQRQRVAVARALAMAPDVLLMDEPLSNLDALLRLEMRAELKALLQETQTTTIYVTHDQVEAMSLADRIAVMHGGEIVQYATPMEVYANPATTFVGGFIGNPPMNFLPLSGELEPALGTTPPGNAAQLGIRPEDIVVTDASAASWSLKVGVVEALGPHKQVSGKLGDAWLRVTVDTNLDVKRGDELPIRPNAPRLRWYDAAGKRIAVGDQYR